MATCSSCGKEIGPDAFFCNWCEHYIIKPELGTKPGIFRRFVGVVVDPLIGITLGFISFYIVAGILGFFWAIMLSLILPLVYFGLFLYWLSIGFTPGKVLMGLRVVNKLDGNFPGFGTMVLREIVGRWLSGLFFGLGYLWALFDKNGEAWHDKLAGTLVVKETHPVRSRYYKQIGIFTGVIFLLIMVASLSFTVKGLRRLKTKRDYSQPTNLSLSWDANERLKESKSRERYAKGDNFASKPIPSVADNKPQQIQQRFGLNQGADLYPSFTLPGNFRQIFVVPEQVTASSYAETYVPFNAFDGREDTCWSEGRSDFGIGEWIQIDFSNSETLTGIGIIPGYNKFRLDKYGDRFTLNPRIKRAKLVFSNGTEFYLNFKDSRNMQYFQLPNINTNFIRIVIQDVIPAERNYPGKSYRSHDTTISEIRILANPSE